jgi:hypothetical protein
MFMGTKRKVTNHPALPPLFLWGSEKGKSELKRKKYSRFKKIKIVFKNIFPTRIVLTALSKYS